MDKYVSYEVAIKLKKRGYNEPCSAMYNGYGTLNTCSLDGDLPRNSSKLYDDEWEFAVKTLGLKQTPDDLCTAPTWTEVRDWLWNIHKIWIDICLWEGYFSSLIKQVVEDEDDDKAGVFIRGTLKDGNDPFQLEQEATTFAITLI